MTGRSSRHEASGVRSTRWAARRLNSPNPLWGSNGVAFGPDGRLYVAQFLAGQISAVETGTGDVEVVVPPDGRAPPALVGLPGDGRRPRRGGRPGGRHPAGTVPRQASALFADGLPA
ncbi:hypothetical protein QFZ43_004240 [Streptomyces afghaniensis]|nr:hypothetical protein [Streptomyces afghaniensis]